MRIVSLTDVNGRPVYVDAEQFVGMTVHEKVTWVAFAHEFLVRTNDSPEAVLLILGLETYVQSPNPESDDALAAASDRAAIEKTRKSPMNAGELKAPRP